MKKYLALLLLPTTTFAMWGGGPQQDPSYISNFCLIKKELPPGVKFSFKSTKIAELMSDNGLLVLSSYNAEKLSFPAQLKPTQLPIALALKNKMYLLTTSGFYSYDFLNNPLNMGYNEVVSIGIKGHIPLMSNIEDITPNELKSFVEIPLNYYFGNKYIENKVKIYLNPTSDTTYTIAKFIPNLALPKGLEITSSQPGRDLKKTTLYSLLAFKYSGSIPITFIKEFENPVPEQHFFLENKNPFYISEQKKCYEPAIENSTVLDREKGKTLYETFVKEQTAMLDDVPDNTEFKNHFTEMIKKKNLYISYPLGHIFIGNGRVEKKCQLNFTTFQNLFPQSNKTAPYKSEDPLREINIPNEETSTIEMTYNGNKTNLHLIKRYFLNKEWKPLKEIVNENDCEPICPKIFRKKEKDYFKDTKINYPQSSYKDDELICGMPGTNNHLYIPGHYSKRRTDVDY